MLRPSPSLLCPFVQTSGNNLFITNADVDREGCSNGFANFTLNVGCECLVDCQLTTEQTTYTNGAFGPWEVIGSGSSYIEVPILCGQNQELGRGTIAVGGGLLTIDFSAINGNIWSRQEGFRYQIYVNWIGWSRADPAA